MIRVTLTNPAGELSKVYTLKVNAKLPVILPKTLKKGTYGKTYKAALKVKGTEPITLILSGDLPEGLKFDSKTGKLEDTPSEACTDRAITIIAANMGGTASKDYTLTIKAVAPKITTTKLPNGKTGSTYSTTLKASGKFKVEVQAANSAKTVKKKYTVNISGTNGSAALTSTETPSCESIAEFYDTYGQEINSVPENREIIIAVWLNAGKVYNPAAAVKQ